MVSPIETLLKPTIELQPKIEVKLLTPSVHQIEVSSPFFNPGDHSKNVQPPLSIVVECEFTYCTLLTACRGTVIRVGTVHGSCGVVGRRKSRTSA